MTPSLFLGLVVSGILIGGLYALAAAGLSLIMGVMRVVNVAHGALYMLGAFFVYTVTVQMGLNFAAAMAVAVVAVFVIGLVMERLIVRPVRHEEVNVLIITFAAAFVLEEIAKFVWSPRYKNIPPYIQGSVAIGALQVDQQRLAAFLVAVILMTLLFFVIRRTRIGKAIRMVAQDEEAALLLGIHVERIHMLTFGVGAALAAAAAALLGPLYLVYPAMGWNPLLRSFAIVILGGMGSLEGTILAGLLMGVIEVMTGYFISDRMTTVAAFVVLVLIIFLRPTGLLGQAVEEK